MADEIVDACCIINLYAATDDFCSLLQAMGPSFHIPQIVLEESLYVDGPDEQDERKTVREEIDLSLAIEANLLRTCNLETAQENALFIRFVSELDDGEATCLAIAQVRGWTVATDDRKAQRLAGECAIDVVTTPELLKRWADLQEVNDMQIRAALQRVRDFARFVPRRDAVLSEWWMEKLGG
jgi:predicted nucleic acid-binding protein